MCILLAAVLRTFFALTVKSDVHVLKAHDSGTGEAKTVDQGNPRLPGPCMMLSAAVRCGCNGGVHERCLPGERRGRGDRLRWPEKGFWWPGKRKGGLNEDRG